MLRQQPQILSRWEQRVSSLSSYVTQAQPEGTAYEDQVHRLLQCLLGKMLSIQEEIHKKRADRQSIVVAQHLPLHSHRKVRSSLSRIFYVETCFSLFPLLFFRSSFSKFKWSSAAFAVDWKNSFISFSFKLSPFEIFLCVYVRERRCRECVHGIEEWFSVRILFCS